MNFANSWSSDQDPNDIDSLEAKRAKLQKTKKDLVEIARLNTKIEQLYAEREASRQRQRKIREEAGIVNDRWHGAEEPRYPSPVVSSLSHSPPESLTSNESSVDVYTVAEHKRPTTIPPKPTKKHKQDTVEVVEDLSDREEDPSDERNGEEAGIEEEGRWESEGGVAKTKGKAVADPKQPSSESNQQDDGSEGGIDI